MAQNTAEGGTNGTTVTTGNSGGSSGDAWQSATVGTGCTLRFSSTQAAHGGLSYEVATGGTSASSFVGWTTTVGTVTDIGGRFYLYMNGIPGSNMSILSTLFNSSVRFRIQVTSAAKLRILDNAGAATWTSTTTLSTGTWYRVEFALHTASPSGTVQIKLFSLDSTTVTEDSTAITTDAGGTTSNNLRFGCITNQINFPTMFFDDIVGIGGTLAFPGPALVTTTPGSVSAVAGIPSPTVSTGSTGANPAPSAVSAIASVPSPAVATGSTVTPASVSATAGVPAPTTRTGSTVAPASVSAVVAVPTPATTTVRTISWSGYTWKVRGVQAAANPGPNDWSDSLSNVSVSGGVLTIAIAKVGAAYYASEIELQQTLGYGEYSFVVNTDLSGLDPWAVLGLYTYDSGTSSPFREIDIEAAKWGFSDTDDLQFTVQPGDGPQVARFPANSSAPYTLEFVWQAGQVYFEARDSGNAVLRTLAVNDAVPTTGAEHLFINAWLYAGHAPNTAATVPFEIASFTFTPSVTTTLPKAATLTESFTSSTPEDWISYGGASISGGNAVMPCTDSYSGWESGQKYDLTSSYTMIDVAGLPAIGNVSTEAQMFVWHDGENYALIEKIGASLLMRVRDSNVDTDNYVTYNSTNHRFWRVDESGGNILFKTSADGSSWTTHYTVGHSMATQMAVTSLRLACGYYATETSPGDFTVAHVGPAATGPTLTAVSAVAGVPSPAVSTGSSVAPGSVAATAGVPSPTVASGSSVAPTSVSAVAAVGAPAVQTGQTASPASVSAVAVVPSPVVSTGVTLAPASVAATAAVPAPTVRTGASVAPASVAAVAGVPAPVTHTGASVAPASVSAAAAVPAPTTRTGSTVTPAAVTAAVAVPAPTVTTTGNATATPSSVSATAGVPAPSMSTGTRVTAAAVTATVSVPAPTVRTGSTVTQVSVSATASVPSPGLSTGSRVTLSAVSATAAVPAPAVTTGVNATATPGSVSAVAAVPAVTVSAGSAAAPSSVQATASVPSPVVSVGATLSIGSVSAVASVPTLTVATDTVVTPVTVSATVGVPSPTLSISATVTGGSVAAVAAVPDAVASGNTAVTVASVSAVARVPAPTVSIPQVFAAAHTITNTSSAVLITDTSTQAIVTRTSAVATVRRTA